MEEREEDWRGALYERSFDDSMRGLERRRLADETFGVLAVEAELAQLYIVEGADQLGRGEVQDITLRATIAAYERFAAALRATTLSVVLGLGGNTGDTRAILRQAVEALGEVLRGVRVAPLYETAPVGVLDQPVFLNTAVAGEFSGEAYALLDAIHVIEARYGRNRAKEMRWGPRTLDIDVLFAGGVMLGDEALTVPHPRLRERRFALEPMVALEPDARDPATGEYYRDVLARLPPQGVVRISDGDWAK
jgi:2-amino-4-hydroxy-6-hydroxymethyldihydropteridine diphosphokinase